MGVRRAAAGLLAVLSAVLGVTVAQAAVPTDAVKRAGAFLVAKQKADGAWTGAQAVDDVADGVIALVAAEISGAALTKALNYVASHGPAEANRAAMTARVILAAVAAARNPRDFGKVDYVGRVRTYYNPNNGNYDAATDPNSLVILALVAAGEKVPEKAITSLQGRQCGDGGLPRAACLFGSDVSTTALALNALAAAGIGKADPVVAKARAYLVAAQNPDGGFGDFSGQPTAGIPTGTAVAAIIAMGEDPTAAPWKKGTANPVTALVALQDNAGGIKADAGQAAGDDMTTIEALPGLAGRPLPVLPPTALPATSTTAAAAAAPATTTTTAPAAVAKRVRPRGTTTVPPLAVPTTRSADVQLAAPAPRRNTTRSILGVLPLALTLLGAGSLGLLLRRRARI